MTPADSHSNAPQVIADALEVSWRLYSGSRDPGYRARGFNGFDADRPGQAVATKQNAIAAHIAARHHREALGLKEALAEQIESHPVSLTAFKRERSKWWLNCASSVKPVVTPISEMAC